MSNNPFTTASRADILRGAVMYPPRLPLPVTTPVAASLVLTRRNPGGRRCEVVDLRRLLTSSAVPTLGTQRATPAFLHDNTPQSHSHTTHILHYSMRVRTYTYPFLPPCMLRYFIRSSIIRLRRRTHPHIHGCIDRMTNLFF